MCYTPSTVLDANKNHISVPCGKCAKCIRTRVSHWSQRLVEEERNSISSWFITLTYGNHSVPISNKKRMSLDKEAIRVCVDNECIPKRNKQGNIIYRNAVSEFIKRLREYQTTSDIQEYRTQQIKYYAVGEYGGRTQRPHYHLLLFNADYELVDKAWSKDGVMIGEVYYGSVTGASVGYVLKYLSKPAKVPMYKGDDRVPEFCLMSKGIGKSYITPEVIRWHTADLDKRMYFPTRDGKKASLARYYKDRIYNSEQRGYLKGYFERYSQDKEGDTIRALGGDGKFPFTSKDVDLLVKRQDQLAEWGNRNLYFHHSKNLTL